jgi:hypothetical protein
MEKAAVLADSRLFLPVSTRDTCVQKQAVLLLPTTTQQHNSTTTTRQQLQLRTATSTINCNHTHLPPVLQPIGTTVFTI